LSNEGAILKNSQINFSDLKLTIRNKEKYMALRINRNKSDKCL